MATAIPKSVATLRNRTRNLYRTWWTAHYFFGLVGVVAGALLTALTAETPAAGAAGVAAGVNDMAMAFPSLAGLHKYGWFIGILAAVATSLITFLGPLHKAEKYWSAFHLLDQACLEYDLGVLDLRSFMGRVQQARVILQASVEPVQQPARTTVPAGDTGDAQAVETAMQVKNSVIRTRPEPQSAAPAVQPPANV